MTLEIYSIIFNTPWTELASQKNQELEASSTRAPARHLFTDLHRTPNSPILTSPYSSSIQKNIHHQAVHYEQEAIFYKPGRKVNKRYFCTVLRKSREITTQKKLSQSLFSRLNPSHASFSVANTAALIIFCSVVAVGGSYTKISQLAKRREVFVMFRKS